MTFPEEGLMLAESLAHMQVEPTCKSWLSAFETIRIPRKCACRGQMPSQGPETLPIQPTAQASSMHDAGGNSRGGA